MRHGRRHGLARCWHKNGVLSDENPYLNGLPHGVSRQWDDTGKLLGQYRMVHGTGVQRVWHELGRLHLEFSTVRGDFCGRFRMWLHDGSLLSDEINLHGKPVTAEVYRAARLKDKSLPKLTSKPGKPLRATRATEKHSHEVFVRWQLSLENSAETKHWLENDGKAVRSLGRFKRVADALKFVDALYRAGGTKVIAPGIYHGKGDAQFADSLLVKLPKATARRKAIRRICATLSKRKLGAFLPEKELGESHLHLMLA